MDFTGKSPEEVLKSVFGYDSFRFLQKDIIQNVLSGNDTLAIMPTGGGKSLCYQIPALIFDGLTVVVSPLISLMQDQVGALNALGVNAVFLNSSVPWETYLDSMNSIRRGETKIVYVSPEGLSSAKIKELMHDERVRVKCVTIDEAHCVSEWGHDFRPDYLEISSIRREFKDAVFLALTATATSQVQKDIIKNLALSEPTVLHSSFNRPNIFLSVRPKRNSLSQIEECIDRHEGESGIIYCFSKKDVDQITEDLRSDGYSALNYHAGLSAEERRNHQQMFIRDDVQIMVATVAFGMGINKPNVRFVIHHTLPKSIEQYYQEIGRAGRDGLPSEAILLYSAGDIKKIRFIFDENVDIDRAERLLKGMTNYCSGQCCRRAALLQYFGEKFEPEPDAKGCCDVCDSGPVPLTDMTIPFQKLLSCIIRTGSRYGAHYVIDVLLGSKSKKVLENEHDKISTYGIGTEMSKEQWLDFVDLLILHDELMKTGEYSVLNITAGGLAKLRLREKIELPFQMKKPDKFSLGKLKFPKPEKSFSAYKAENYGSDGSTSSKIVDELKKWRREEAVKMKIPPYLIFGDRTLFDIASKKPTTLSELLDCHGIGENKAAKFSGKIFDIVSRFSD